MYLSFDSLERTVVVVSEDQCLSLPSSSFSCSHLTSLLFTLLLFTLLVLVLFWLHWIHTSSSSAAAFICKCTSKHRQHSTRAWHYQISQIIIQLAPLFLANVRIIFFCWRRKALRVCTRSILLIAPTFPISSPPLFLAIYSNWLKLFSLKAVLLCAMFT